MRGWDTFAGKSALSKMSSIPCQIGTILEGKYATRELGVQKSKLED